MSDYTFHEAVAAIDRATITGRPFPRSLHDNVAAGPHDAGERMLLLDWPTAADRDQWLDYFGVGEPVNGVRWADNWHGWTVVLTAHREDSGAGAATSCTTPAPAPVEVLTDGAALASALLDPDASIGAPCGQTSRHESHGSHVRHEGAYSRCCDGWADTPTAEFVQVWPS